MTDGGYATKHVNGVGEVRWQPTLPEGTLLYFHSGFGGKIWTRPYLKGTKLYLYRSRKRATRIAKREERRRLKDLWIKEEE